MNGIKIFGMIVLWYGLIALGWITCGWVCPVLLFVMTVLVVWIATSVTEEIYKCSK